MMNCGALNRTRSVFTAALVFVAVFALVGLLPALAFAQDEDEGAEEPLEPGVKIAECVVSLSQTSFIYDGAEHKPEVGVTYEDAQTGEQVALAEDAYTVEYADDCTDVGTYEITVANAADDEDAQTVSFTIEPCPLKNAAVTLAKKSYKYNGTARKPAVSKVVVDGRALERGEDYTVSYKNNVKVGPATVVVSGAGNYAGAKNVTFAINPKGTKFAQALERGERCFYAYWKLPSVANRKQITGYQIQYSKSKTFAKGNEIKTFKKKKLKAGTVAKLAQKSTYYARIRTYKAVNGKKYVSAWSKKKSVRTYANDVLVVTIDPGHGGIDSGASGYGRLEKHMTLKLAEYLKEELEGYDNVVVYMTRTSDRSVALGSRVPFAVKRDSDLFISLHLDWSGAGTNGATVLVPGAHYHKELCWSSQTLGLMILDELSSRIGFKDRGLLRRYQGGSRYPNGTTKDYYRVIRHGVEYGIMSILVEHGFIDSGRDMSKMNTNAKLRKVAKADALGIAKYFGLSTQDWSTSYKALGKRTKMVSRHWLLKGGKYYFVNNDETLVKNKKKTINGVKYVFGKTGALVSDSSGKKAPKP